MSKESVEIDWTRVWQGDFGGAQQVYHESLEVQYLPSCGRGVVTVAPLYCGEVLVAERALQVAPEKDLAEKLQKQQMDLEEIVWKRLDLMCDDLHLEPFSKAVPLRSWPGDLGRPKSLDNTISLGCMRRKVDLNAYRCGAPLSHYAVSLEAEPDSEDQRHSNYGVFPLASLFNHSCAPNMCKVLLADWVFLRAARDIEPGEELTQFYCDIRMPVLMRQKELKELFGFSCNCARCRFELLLENGESSLELWRRLYSCEVPLIHQRFAAEMQGVVSSAEAAVMDALKQLGNVTDQDQKISGESWALWPLVPAFQQLAMRLRLDGRFEESLEIFRRADAVVRSVVPLSNIHLRLHTEMLMTSSTDDLLLENLWLVAAGFGSGLQVWQMLVGFRLSRQLHQRVTSLPAPHVRCGCHIHYRWEELEKRKILIAWCAAFGASHEILVDASTDMLILNAPDAVELKVSCSKVDVATMETKFSRKRRCLTLRLNFLP